MRRTVVSWPSLIDLLVIVVFGAILLLSFCGIVRAADDGHVLEWNESEGADFYWIYYTPDASDWTCMRRYQILSEPPYCDGVTCTDLGELEAHVASLGRVWRFVTVTAVNAAGESDWDSERSVGRWGCE